MNKPTHIDAQTPQDACQKVQRPLRASEKVDVQKLFPEAEQKPGKLTQQEIGDKLAEFLGGCDPALLDTLSQGKAQAKIKVNIQSDADVCELTPGPDHYFFTELSPFPIREDEDEIKCKITIFRQGDWVRLKSGGPTMFIRAASENQDGEAVAYCEWYDQARLESNSDAFSIDQLEKLPTVTTDLGDGMKIEIVRTS